MNNSRLMLKGNVDQIADRLLQLIEQYGAGAAVADVIIREAGNGQVR